MKIETREARVKLTESVIPTNPGSVPGQAPESRTAQESRIPGRASLIRNDVLPCFQDFCKNLGCREKEIKSKDVLLTLNPETDTSFTLF